MPLSRRYTPEKPPSEVSTFGMSFEYVIPPGVGISTGSLAILTNTVAPADASHDFTLGVVSVRGRTLYANLSGGVDGTDYQFRWTVSDTDGNVWVRTGLCLVAETS